VPRRDAFVAEVAVDLVHFRDPADDEPLQVELGSDPQEEVEVQRVVVRHERTGHRTARDGLHHRRLDLEIAPLVQEAPQVPDDGRAAFEDFPGLRVHREIEIPLAIPALDVLEAMPLLGQRTEALGEKREVPGLDRQLPRSRPEDLARDTDPVAEVQGPVELEGLVADDVPLQVDLQPRPPVREIQKARFARGPKRQDPAGGRGLHARGIQLLARGIPVRGHDLGHRRRDGKLHGIDGNPERLQSPEILAAVLEQIAVGFGVRAGLGRRLGHRARV
jgi:hypothetical protein